MQYTDIEFTHAVLHSKSKSEICRRFQLHINGSSLKLINDDIERLGLDISHFLGGGQLSRKWEIIIKTCPVCNKEFETHKDHPKEKTTCSYSCSNTHFRSGRDNPNWKEVSDAEDRAYRDICFQHYEPKCVICEWDISVDVHHIDGDHHNNNIINLIPLCKNHHHMTRINVYKDKINKQIIELRNQHLEQI